MRQLSEHKVNPANDLIDIKVVEAHNGKTGEPFSYQLKIPNGRTTQLEFQFGPINEVGVNGITNEALLAIVADRMRYFQNGPYSCRENALALTKLEEAMHWLHARTRRRMEEGTEGTHKLPG